MELGWCSTNCRKGVTNLYNEDDIWGQKRGAWKMEVSEEVFNNGQYQQGGLQ